MQLKTHFRIWDSPIQLAFSLKCLILIWATLLNSVSTLSPPMFQTQPGFVRQDLNDLLAIMNADRVSKLLRSMANKEMGIVSIQSMLDELLYKNIDYDHSANLKKTVSNIEKRLGFYQKMLDRASDQIIKSFKNSPYDVHLFTHFKQCCTFERQFLKFETQYGSSVNLSRTCDIMSRSISAFSFHPGPELLKVFELNGKHQTGIWQYFMSPEGLHVEYPARHLDEKNYTNCIRLEHERHRSIFIKASLNFKKQIVILIDRGSAMSNSQLETAKCVAKALISSLDSDDEVTVLLVGEEVTFPTHLHCSNESVFLAIPDVKEHLYGFINSARRSNGHTNHSAGFIEAFNILKSIDSSSQNDRPMIIYLSRGMFSQLTDGTSVMAAIAESNAKLGNKIQINTFALIDPGKAVMWETTFLRDVAAQNFNQYAQSFRPELLKLLKNHLKPPEGRMFVVNTSNDYCIELKEIYEALKPAGHRLNINSNQSILKYCINRLTPDCSTISFAKIVVYKGRILGKERFLGVVGLDVCLRNFASPIVYYGSSDATSYAFLIDKQGRTYVHPKLSSLVNDDVPVIDVGLLETNLISSEKSLSLKSGFSERQEGVMHVRLEDDQNENLTSFNVKSYYWKNIGNTSFIVVIASSRKDNSEKNSRTDRKASLANTLAYHRLDLLINKDLRLCTQGKLLASIERCGLFLSPKCFDKAYERTLFAEDLRSAQGYWAYITDHTKLITNPGLKSEKLRNEIAEWSKMVKDWKIEYARSPLKSVILRKYIATPSGIMLTYPASYVHQNLDPTQRNWYRRSLAFPGKIVLTQPILDFSGTGYVVSVSTTVFEGKQAAMHNPNEDRIVAVIAMDLPLTFLYKLLNEYRDLGICREQRVNCFLFDDRGYVVAHRNNFFDTDASVSQVFEQMHLTYKEPAIASELLQNKQFMKKIICNNYGSRSIQRYYLVNTSYSGVLRSGDNNCFRYQIAPVPNTNVFLAIVNRSCVRQSAFCPCSVTDRKCLNCRRSEPLECECPCECPTTGLYCDDSESDFSKYATCEPFEENVKAPIPDSILSLANPSPFPRCLDINCANFVTESDCLGNMGCEWCTYEDPKTALNKPFCTSVTQCYGGILGLTPYGNLIKNYAAEQFVPSTPVGPMAGGIMSVFVVLVLGVLWYRHKVSRMVEARCGGRYGGGTGTGSGSRLYDSDDLDNEFNFDNGGMSKPDCQENNGTLLLLTSFERENLPASSIAPRPRPIWRRGPRTESSDPGYSTMTGNCDDSEQATTVEQLSPRRSKSNWTSLLNSTENVQNFGKETILALTGTHFPPTLCLLKDGVEVDEVISEVSGFTANENKPLAALETKDQLTTTASTIGQTVLPHESSRLVTTTAIVHAVDA